MPTGTKLHNLSIYSVNLLQSHYTYIILIAFTISGPFLLSFDKKVAFYKEWKHFFWAMLPTSLAYILWDVIATKTGVWKFNTEFLLGPFIGNLPLEEYLFFIVIPMAAIMTIEGVTTVKPHLREKEFGKDEK